MNLYLDIRLIFAILEDAEVTTFPANAPSLCCQPRSNWDSLAVGNETWQETCLPLEQGQSHDLSRLSASSMDTLAPSQDSLLIPETRFITEAAPQRRGEGLRVVSLNPLPSEAIPSRSSAVNQFERIKPGPEQDMMAHLRIWGVAWMAHQLVCAWAAAGLTVGAGDPDLLLVRHRPDLGFLDDATDIHLRLMTCIRQTPGLTLQDLESRMRVPSRQIAQIAEDLKSRGVLDQHANGYALSMEWRDPLQEVIAVEAKISKWREAAQQAVRNTIFAHQSYIALPLKLAIRIAEDPLLSLYRIGLLGVGTDGSVTTVKEAPKLTPSVWYYHYYVANVIARTTLEPTLWSTSSRSRKPSVVIRNTSSLGH